MKKEIDIDFDKYLEVLYKEAFSTYDFLLLFCALNACNNTMHFNKDELLEFIEICKSKEIYDGLLKNIKITENNYSDDLEETITVLKWASVLYSNPDEENKIFLFDYICLVDIIKSRLDYLNEMILFICDFDKYQLAKNGLISNHHPDQVIIKSLMNNRK